MKYTLLGVYFPKYLAIEAHISLSLDGDSLANFLALSLTLLSSIIRQG